MARMGHRRLGRDCGGHRDLGTTWAISHVEPTVAEPGRHELRAASAPVRLFPSAQIRRTYRKDFGATRARRRHQPALGFAPMKVMLTLKQLPVSRRAAASRFGSRRRPVDIPTTSLCVASTRLDEPSTTTTDPLPSAQRYISFSMSWRLSQQCVRAMCGDGRDQVKQLSLEWPCA